MKCSSRMMQLLTASLMVMTVGACASHKHKKDYGYGVSSKETTRTTYQDHNGDSVKTTSSSAVSNNAAEPDNSAVNKRDHDENAYTADHQASKGTKNDVELTRLIRRALTKDDSLSSYAHNVKIITEEGDVTLRGPVHSQQEKLKVASYAKKIVGSNHVHNQLQVKQ